MYLPTIIFQTGSGLASFPGSRAQEPGNEASSGLVLESGSFWERKRAERPRNEVTTMLHDPDGNQAFTEVSNLSPLLQPWIKHLFLQWTTIFAELLRYLY